jgi:hypothetical protein
MAASSSMNAAAGAASSAPPVNTRWMTWPSFQARAAHGHSSQPITTSST